jgi:hypothetical protein
VTGWSWRGREGLADGFEGLDVAFF